MARKLTFISGVKSISYSGLLTKEIKKKTLALTITDHCIHEKNETYKGITKLFPDIFFTIVWIQLEFHVRISIELENRPSAMY